MGTLKDYYQVLGVTPRSHARAIEERYWEQAHELHNEPTRRAVKRLRLINEAYETLGSPYRREHYDKQRAQMVSADGAREGPHLLHIVLSVLSKPFRPD